MTQKVLFEERDEVIKTEKKEEIIDREVERDSVWNEIHKMTTKCEKEDEPCRYAFVEYNCKTDLNGREEWVSISSTTNRRRKELGSSSGCGGWVTFKEEEDGEELKDELLWVRKAVCDKPYTSECCVNDGGGENDFLTDIKIENTIVSFSKQAIEFLERKGFSVEGFYKEFNSLKQRKATKEDIKKSTTFELMEKQTTKLRDECWAIKGYFEDCSFLPKPKRMSKDYYSSRLKEFKIDTTDLNKLKDLYILKVKQYQIFSSKVYFQRWGKAPEEEYSYP